jgi:hypothetical protein
VIRVFNLPAITWTLTAVLLFSGSYHFLQATKAHQRTDRVNNILHGIMNVLMVAMLWNLVPSTMLAQIAVLTAAALWFVIQAVARPEFKILCAGSQSRLKCAYHSVTMAGAALMVAMMGDHAGGAGHGSVPAGGTPLASAHHTMPAATPNTAGATFDHLPVLASPLTALFAVAAVFFLALLLRTWLTNATHRDTAAPKPSVGTEHGLEALGAAIMALMFATMAAPVFTS